MNETSENIEPTVDSTVQDEVVETPETIVPAEEAIIENNNSPEALTGEGVEETQAEVENDDINEDANAVEEPTSDTPDGATEPANEVTTSTTNPDNACPNEEGCENIFWQVVIIVGVAVIILVALSAILKSKKKKNVTNKGKKKSFKSNPNAVEIYVGNLSYEMGNSELRKEFEKFGIVTSARIITQRNSRKSKGYGFVEMPHRSEAEEAIRALNNKEIKGRKIHVNEARANTRHENH